MASPHKKRESRADLMRHISELCEKVTALRVENEALKQERPVAVRVLMRRKHPTHRMRGTRDTLGHVKESDLVDCIVKWDDGRTYHIKSAHAVEVTR